jgi:hypothetical protein
MFFDNNVFYKFMYRLLAAGINVPVVAGIMPVTNSAQLDRIVSLSGSGIPLRFKAIADRFASDPDAMKQAGIAYATEQIIDLVASGVLIEAYSVEDGGRGVCFCIYAYNVQPGIDINYFTGQTTAAGEDFPEPEAPSNGEDIGSGVTVVYILNTNSKKFHYPDKSCSNNIKPENRREYTGTREELISDGYSACGSCKP